MIITLNGMNKSQIVKSCYLQHVLREEVKDKLKWNVDRSSPSNKIQDLMKWSKDILHDIYYQRRVMSNWFTAFLTNNWSELSSDIFNCRFVYF